jgi:hypothetical protein
VAKQKRIPSRGRNSIAGLHAVHPIVGRAVVAKNIEDAQARDEEVAIWDELNSAREACIALLVTPVLMRELAGRKDLIKFVRDKAGLVTRVNMFKRDIMQLKAELFDIAKRHEGKVGGSSDIDEIMNANMISEQYELFKLRLEATIPPTVNHIIEIFTEAELIMKQTQAASAEVPADTAEDSAASAAVQGDLNAIS